MNWNEAMSLFFLVFIVLFLGAVVTLTFFIPKQPVVFSFEGINNETLTMLQNTNTTALMPLFYDCVKYCTDKFGGSSHSSLQMCYDQCKKIIGDTECND